MEKNSSHSTSTSSNVVLNILQGQSKAIKYNTETSNHDYNYEAYDSTSTDSDIEKRIRIKATRFSKAYPKRSCSNKVTNSNTPQSIHAGAGEDILTNNNNSNKNGTNTKSLTSLCHQQNKHINLSSVLKKSVEVEQHLNRFRDICSTHLSKTTQSPTRSYPDYIEMFSSYETDDSSSEESISKLSEDSLHLGSQDLLTLYKTQINESDSNIKKFKDASTKVTDTSGKISTPKSTRPFKSYPEDPLALTIGFDTARISICSGRPENYNEFRRRMLGNKNWNKSDINTNMRRFQMYTTDKSYRERRNKNNIAAKRSRDARRAKEDELAIRCAYLEQENMFLKRKVAEMEEEKRKLNIS